MTPRAETRKPSGMSDNWRMVLIIVIPSVLLTVQTIGVAYLTVRVPAQLNQVHDLVNSVSEKLRAAESAEASAEGEIRGAEKERARAAEKQP